MRIGFGIDDGPSGGGIHIVGKAGIGGALFADAIVVLVSVPSESGTWPKRVC